MRTGFANLPIHWGKAPRWLFHRMAKLARQITIAIVEEYGSVEILRRISDPYWFQALGCVLGYDWHSSGLTTVTCAALKQGIKGLEKELNLFAAGGKGATSRKTPHEIHNWAEEGVLKVNPEQLQYASKMAAKVDSTAIQDGYQLYHHSFFFTQEGSWTVVQQGFPALSNNGRPATRSYSLHRLNYSLFQSHKVNSYVHHAKKLSYARRYHWMSEKTTNFVDSPNAAICDNKQFKYVLNLTSERSSKARDTITEISLEKPNKIIKEYKKIQMLTLPGREWIEKSDMLPKNLEQVLLSTYERRPKNFEELLGMEGIGPKSIRALTLISELAFGTKADWKDPVKYSFAHGGKDGYPYPVDKVTYDKSIEILKEAVNKAKVNRRDKKEMLTRLL